MGIVMTSRSSSLLRLGAAAGLGALLLLPATSADAHVRVSADSTAPGSFSALTFRVPDESATAGTVRLSVRLPQDTPFLSVSSRPVPGWRLATTEAALPKPVESEGTTLTKAVRTVTWTAEKGTQIAPGEYQEFSISVGPLPAIGTVLLPATQTYSDGTVVSWDQPTPAGGEEPEHPAPALVVAVGEASAAPAAPPGTPAAVSGVASRADGVARGLGGAGLALGLAALVVAVLGARRRRSGASA
jgi:periplasmic copper chaperone A